MKIKNLFEHKFERKRLQELDNCQDCNRLGKQGIFSQYCSNHSNIKNYRNFQEGKDIPYADEAKVQWQQQYSTHFNLLDKNFYQEFPTGFLSRCWELKVFDFLHEHQHKGIELKELKGKQSKPDGCFTLAGKFFYPECICVNPWEKLPYQIKEHNGRLYQVGSWPSVLLNSRFKEKVSQALKEKTEKYTKGYEAYIMKHGEGGLILFISIPSPSFDAGPIDYISAILSCLLPTSEIQQFPIIVGKNNQLIMGKPYYECQKSYAKSSNNASIENYYFDNKDFNHISAVIVSTSPHVFFPNIDKYEAINWGRIRNDFLLFHNPQAKYPLPKGFFVVQKEIEIAKSSDKKHYRVTIFDYK